MKYTKRTTKDIRENFLEELLLDRGIITTDEDFCNKFFTPTKDNELPPEALDNMEEGYQMLMKHLKGGHKFYLVIDPDFDGYSSAALFYNYLMDNFSQYNPDIVYHIPDGKAHGLDSIMDWFPEDGTDSLIVLPDSSSNDFKEHEILSARGYDLLICDHHLAPHYSEHAVVINNQLSDGYSNKDLSGVGVVYKFFEYVEKRENLPPFSENYLDLVATGQIGDMMGMSTLENRYILTKGLSKINNGFLAALFEKQDFSTKGERNQITVSFYISPLINSLIRFGCYEEKERMFKAFINADMVVPSTKRGHGPDDTEILGQQVARICGNTKDKQNKERDKAVELFDMQIIENCLDENKIIVLNADELDIPRTMTGLCAMGVVSKYKKPVLIGRHDKEGHFKGSVRVPDNCGIANFKEFLLESNLMTFAEGHAAAFGFDLKNSNVDKLIAYANEKLANVDFNKGDWEVDFIVNGNCSYLKELIDELTAGTEFWGQGCPEPLVAVENIRINSKSEIQYKGKVTKNTVAFDFNGVEYIKFKDDDLVAKLKECSAPFNLTIIGIPQINTWGGMAKRQVQIKEIEITPGNEYDF